MTDSTTNTASTATTASTASQAPGPSDTATPCCPPPPAPSAPRLVRDPTTGLGGVASGIAHHYRLDVELVRIVFIIAALTTGFGVIAYLVAWAIIPLADYWPPAPVAPRSPAPAAPVPSPAA